MPLHAGLSGYPHFTERRYPRPVKLQRRTSEEVPPAFAMSTTTLTTLVRVIEALRMWEPGPNDYAMVESI